MFDKKPGIKELTDIFDLMVDAGGSEPGFVNAQTAKERAPWFKGCNPCVEILLGNKSFCNLTEVNLMAFKDDHKGLEEALYLAARLNYRQTCVNLKDEILQEAWHQNNDYLRLCGVGLTGIAGRTDLKAYDYKVLRGIAIHGAYRMTHELGTPMPKNVTTIKPSGTLSKIMGNDKWGEVSEGIHTPLGKYIFNNISFSKHDDIVPLLRNAGYKVMPKPQEPESVLITMPVVYDTIKFDIDDNGKEVNKRSAIHQLDEYKKLMIYWCDQNVSVTISYDITEVKEIINWILNNWDCYVGVSFLFRTDASMTAKDLGYEYLPQEVVTKEVYEDYVSSLQEIDYDVIYKKGKIVDDLEDGCSTGSCPVR